MNAVIEAFLFLFLKFVFIIDFLLVSFSHQF